MRDLIIIGAGPAGLSAAVYAKRAQLDVLVLEKEAFQGGQIVYTEQVDNYLGIKAIDGFGLAEKFREHAESFGVEFLEGAVESIRDEAEVKTLVLEDGTELEAKSILIATGAKHRLLQVPGEEEFAGAGVSYCATCDGAFFSGKTVAVIGGGDVALEDALYLSNICESVYLVHRREEFRANSSLQKLVREKDNIKLQLNAQVKEIKGEKTVEALVLNDSKADTEIELVVDGVFVAVGMEPVSGFAKNIVETDEAGYIVAGENCRTNVAGIFAAGDVRTKQVRQVVTAVADGAVAISSVLDTIHR